MQARQKPYIYGFGVVLLLTFSGCNHEVVGPTASFAGLAPPPFASLPADPDSTMGPLSGIARHIVAALRSRSVRASIASAMKSPEAGRLGLSLSGCANDAVVGNLLRAGELAGGDAAHTMCTRIRTYRGLVLYMDPDRLRAWDGTTIPLVTAIAHPERGLSVPLHAYRSPTTTISLPADGSVQGPILVVLPYVHGAAITLHARDDATLNTIHVPQLQPGLVRDPAPVHEPRSER